MRDVTAIIVARANSRRLPGKAMLPFRGTTLIGAKIEMLKQCRRVHRIVVGSDGESILNEAEKHGADVVERDEYHCDESRCTANEMIGNMIEHAGVHDDGIVLWAHPTNPLIESKTFDDAVRTFNELPLHYDSLCSVRREQRHAWFEGVPLNHRPDGVRHLPASELKPVFFQDGAIFIQMVEHMRVFRAFTGKRPYLFEVDADEGTDIDTRADYELALWHEARRSRAEVCAA